ncbi:MAG: PBP1A family penicillin-binding protein [Bacteroidetes bacterium]|nr:PBP1A family penicillin-binding protein [Bacteroidota bacterium]MBU1421735.1 PBP1A family penicillin-binding protein [Bacteroidota bacterium]MBU2636044.1 PBP1A family penicillin-binding protein [Bacteroidota bacterium]
MAKKKSFLKRHKKKILVAFAVFILLLAIYIPYIISGLPSLEDLENPKAELATKVYSIDGEVLDQFFIKNRTQVSLNQLPPHLINALIATEDKNFKNHWGVDLPRFFRAMVKNIVTLRLREGASTITQQLSRNLYDLKIERKKIHDKITRKFREFITAFKIETNYTKDEILEMYFNVAYFGRSAYGVSAASQIYFGKLPTGLTLSESALLVGLLKGPANYDPINYPDRATNRRNTVLSQMVKYDYLTEEEAEKAKDDEIQIRSSESEGTVGIAPHFVEYVRQQLEQKAEQYGFDIYRDGLSIYTTLDSRMQRYANRAVEEHLAEYQPLFNKQWKWDQNREVLVKTIDLSIKTSDAYRKAKTKEQRDSIARSLRHDKAFIDTVKRISQRIEVGFVAIDHRSGGIVALVGGSNFRNFKYGLNHVTQIYRQAGSTFKPFIYTVAIDNGYPPSYEILNQPVTLVMADGKRWTPGNFDDSFGGKYTIRDGLKLSVNLVAVRAIMEIAPIQQVIEYSARMGIKSKLPPYESLSLGTGEVQPLELITAFSVFANDGILVQPISILRIEDKDENIIEENQPERKEVLSKETAYIITSILEDAVNRGTGTRVRNFFHLPAAGKTGTTQEYADAWFVGFTPKLTAGVWIGFDNKSVHFTNYNGQGGRAAAPVWGKFMNYVYDDKSIGLPLEFFIQPEGVVKETICAETKGLATEYCPTTEEEIFNRKYLPNKCTLHTSSHWEDSKESRDTINF